MASTDLAVAAAASEVLLYCSAFTAAGAAITAARLEAPPPSHPPHLQHLHDKWHGVVVSGGSAVGAVCALLPPATLVDARSKSDWNDAMTKIANVAACVTAAVEVARVAVTGSGAPCTCAGCALLPVPPAVRLPRVLRRKVAEYDAAVTRALAAGRLSGAAAGGGGGGDGTWAGLRHAVVAVLEAAAAPANSTTVWVDATHSPLPPAACGTVAATWQLAEGGDELVILVAPGPPAPPPVATAVAAPTAARLCVLGVEVTCVGGDMWGSPPMAESTEAAAHFRIVCPVPAAATGTPAAVRLLLDWQLS